MKLSRKDMMRIINEEINYELHRLDEAEEDDVAQIRQAQTDLDKAVDILESVLDTLETLDTHSSKPLGISARVELDKLYELMKGLKHKKAWLEKHLRQLLTPFKGK